MRRFDWYCVKADDLGISNPVFDVHVPSFTSLCVMTTETLCCCEIGSISSASHHGDGQLPANSANYTERSDRANSLFDLRGNRGAAAGGTRSRALKACAVGPAMSTKQRGGGGVW